MREPSPLYIHVCTLAEVTSGSKNRVKPFHLYPTAAFQVPFSVGQLIRHVVGIKSVHLEFVKSRRPWQPNPCPKSAFHYWKIMHRKAKSLNNNSWGIWSHSTWVNSWLKVHVGSHSWGHSVQKSREVILNSTASLRDISSSRIVWYVLTKAITIYHHKWKWKTGTALHNCI